jgi:hypothetical protein
MTITEGASPPAAAKDTRKRHDGPPKVRALTLDDLDRRTKAAQAAFEMQDRLVAERGGAEQMGVLRYEMTRTVAVLSAMIQDQQVRWLKGESIEPATIATLVNTRQREAQAIGIDPLPKEVTLELKGVLQDSPPIDSGSPPMSQTDGAGTPLAGDRK